MEVDRFSLERTAVDTVWHAARGLLEWWLWIPGLERVCVPHCLVAYCC